MYKFYSKSKARVPMRVNLAMQQCLRSGVLLTLLLLSINVIARAQQITIKETRAPLKKVFQDLSKQTGFEFLASSAVLDVSQPVTFSVKDQPLGVVLETIFKTQPLKYEIRDKIIVVTKKEVTQTSPRKDQTTTAIFKGKIIDTIGNPLPGATIKNLSRNLNVTTSNNGEFEIDGSPGDEISVSFIGFLPYNFHLNDKLDYLTIVLKTGTSKLNEVNVVSTGYQTIPKERITGSFAQPLKNEYENRVAPDVISKLNGITSGLVFNANTLTTQGGKPDINIRGRSTIFANDQPLIVVDNFPYSGDINNINPNDVESISVLKDAAAASIWGVRAGNGVIVITTRKGKNNQALKIGFNANLTVFNRPDLNYNPNQLDASSYIGLEQYLFGKGFYDASLANTSSYPVISPVVSLLAANRAGTVSTNDLNTQLNVLRNIDVKDQLSKYFYQKATNQQYAINLSGGSDKAIYYFSAGYDHDLASVKDNSNQRFTLNSQNTFFITPKLEVNAGINYIRTNTQFDNTLTQTARRLFPYSQIADKDGNPLPISYNYNQTFIQNSATTGFLDWTYYPLKELGATDNTTKTSDARISTGIKYTFIPGLSAEVKYQFENTQSDNRIYQSQDTYATRDYINTFSVVNNGVVTGYNVPLGGILNLSRGNTISNNVRGQLSYSNHWSDNDLVAILGYELSQTTGESNQSILYGYNNDLATFTNIDAIDSFNTYPTGSQSIYSGLGVQSTIVRVRSSFANIAYNYKDRYTVSGSARIDGTNYFGVSTNQKNLPLWSAGFKWDISRESFYKLDWLPVLALRTSYGYNGNLIQSITGITTFQYYSNATYTNYNYALISNIGNPDLRWEKTGIANIGVDFGTKNGNIAGSLEYYFKRESDLLGFKNFPENSGITQLEGNFSNMKGSGYDLSITSHNTKGNLKWNTTLLLSHATDKVTSYDVQPYSYQLAGSGTGAPNINRPVFGVYAYKWRGLDPATGNPIGFVNGSPSQDYSAITVNTPVQDLVYEGPARPTYFGGLNNSFSYKNFRLTFQVNYKLGYYFMAPALNYSTITTSGAFLRVNNQFNDRWQVPGDEKRTNVPSLVYPFSSSRDQFYKYSEVNVESGDHIRLQDITLSYDFTKSTYHRLPFAALQLFIYANNVGIIWRKNNKGLDPDAVPTTDNTTMPVPRSIAIGIKGNF